MTSRDMNKKHLERRVGPDRRADAEGPSFKYLLMGRRRGPRRADDYRTTVYVEVYGLKLFIAVLLIVMLSTSDALFTLYHVSRGAREINPTMKYLLEMGANEFFYVKYTLTCLGVLFLTMHKNLPWVKEILMSLILIYLMVISWHIYLLSVY